MSKKTKRFWISAAFVVLMFFFVDPSIVAWLWSAFPPSVAEWGKVIRFVLYWPVIVVTFYAVIIVIGIFYSAAEAKDSKKRLEEFRKKNGGLNSSPWQQRLDDIRKKNM